MRDTCQAGYATIGVVSRSSGKRTVYGIFAVLAVVATEAACLPMPIRRDAEYSRVVKEFKEAGPLAQRTLDASGNVGWDADFAVAGGVTAHLRAGMHLTDARVHYADEQSPRPVFDYKDYTNISDIRVRDSVLYVLRVISLFQNEYRLTVYDLNRRAVVTDRRIALTDVK